VTRSSGDAMTSSWSRQASQPGVPDDLPSDHRIGGSNGHSGLDENLQLLADSVSRPWQGLDETSPHRDFGD